MSITPALDATIADLRGMQRKRKQVAWFAVVACGAVLTVVEPIWRPAVPGAFALITNLGLLLIAVCIVGRTWCTLYIGGHKKRQLTTHGPYLSFAIRSMFSRSSALPGSALNLAPLPRLSYSLPPARSFFRAWCAKRNASWPPLSATSSLPTSRVFRVSGLALPCGRKLTCFWLAHI